MGNAAPDWCQKDWGKRMFALLDRALCAAWDWTDRFEEEHPTAAVAALVVLATAGYALVGTLEYGTL